MRVEACRQKHPPALAPFARRLPPSGRAVTLKGMKMLVVDITAADAGNRLGRYKVSERRQDGSLVLVPETVEEVVAETVDRPLTSDEFLDALDRLSAASSQQPD